MRLPPEKRAQLLAELRERERLTFKAISRRHGISRQTLTRLRAEMIADNMLASQNDSDKQAPTLSNRLS